MVIARPETVWLTRSVIVANACSRAAADPAAIPANNASDRTSQPGPSTREAVHDAQTAPISIMPSTPRFSTPERSVSTPPSAENSNGVP
ncbi:unannotated protein [freshwater metagenome]|uniref:Unannotated protein n=1 Tax=freshwater metagenome TaxID=449393 RepID=A0A6J6S8U3_9ZZZZ